MSSKVKKNTIEVSRNIGPTGLVGSLPSFISLAQRHFEKEKPEGKKDGEDSVFVLPVDLLRLSLGGSVVEGIESMEIGYKRKGG